MSESFYTVEAEIEKVAGVHRRVGLPSGDRFDVGVHGSIKAHYKLDETPDCWGTLNGVLEAREIPMAPDAIRATAYGTNEIRDRLPVLTRIHVHYRLRVPAGTREGVEKALLRHASRCPTAMSLKGAVEVTWEADVEEGASRWRLEGSRDG